MNMQAVQPLYEKFTPEERLHLVLAAIARRDLDEVARLRESCPRVKVVTGDPRYTKLLDGMGQAGMEILYYWLDVSHFVVRTHLAIAALNRCLWAHKMLMRSVPGCRKELKPVAREDRAALVAAEAHYKKSSAAWKGIEAAITRFCLERHLTTQQLFAMVQGLPRAIEEAREDLDADVAADPHAEDAAYQALCHVWPGQDARDGGQPQNPRAAAGQT